MYAYTRTSRERRQTIGRGIPLAAVVRKHGISHATCFAWKSNFTWKSKYAGASVAELKRMKELEAENARLKRLYAELAL